MSPFMCMLPKNIFWHLDLFILLHNQILVASVRSNIQDMDHKITKTGFMWKEQHVIYTCPSQRFRGLSGIEHRVIA